MRHPLLKLSAISLLLSNIYACRTVDTSSSKPKLETDDRWTEKSKNLEDVSDKVNSFINQQIEEARRTVNPQQKEWTDKLKMDLIQEVGKRISKPRPGTGVGVYIEEIGLSLEVSTVSEIEHHFEQSLKDGTEVVRTLFKDSRYGENKIGPKALVISHLLRSTADHSISPIIRVGDSLIGLDKLGHFAEQGLWYFLATQEGLLASEVERFQFGQYMEGDPALDKELHSTYKKIYGKYCRACVIFRGGFGYYGMESTGVCSFADIEANESGYQFYKNLYDEPQAFVFQIEAIDTKRWNETVSKNTYKPGLQVRDLEDSGS